MCKVAFNRGQVIELQEDTQSAAEEPPPHLQFTYRFKQDVLAGDCPGEKLHSFAYRYGMGGLAFMKQPTIVDLAQCEFRRYCEWESESKL